MRPVEVIVVLPNPQFLIQIHIIGVGQELVAFEVIGTVGAFHFAVQPGGSGFDVNMPYPQILDVPVELGLELVAVIRPYRMDAEREPLYDKVDKFDCHRLVVPVVDSQRPDAGGIIYGGILETPDGHARWVFEHQEFNIDLDVMPRDLLLVTLGLNGAEAGVSGQSIKPASL